MAAGAFADLLVLQGVWLSGRRKHGGDGAKKIPRKRRTLRVDERLLRVKAAVVALALTLDDTDAWEEYFA